MRPIRGVVGLAHARERYFIYVVWSKYTKDNAGFRNFTRMSSSNFECSKGEWLAAGLTTNI